MTSILESHDYGKSRVRVLKVIRGGERHAIRELTAQVILRGDFGAAYTAADNSRVIPTDTMKNTIYVLARNHPVDSIESFAVHLADHFTKTYEPVAEAEVELTENPWRPVDRDGAPHPHAFIRQGNERGTCRVSVSGNKTRVAAGLTGLTILKTTGSAFRGFPRDALTTLPEADDRLLATTVTARWDFADGAADYAGCRAALREALVQTFADHQSESVQHTLHAMASRALELRPEIERIHLSLPNQHCLLVDLQPFGLDNDGEIFLPIDEPSGLIEATVARV